MKRVGLAALLAVLTFAPDANSQDWSPSEADMARLNAQPFEQTFAEAPEGETYPIELLYWIARKALADLYYPVDLRTAYAPLNDADTMEAIRQFEARIGVNPDGILSFAEYSQLQSYAQLSALTRIYIGGRLNVSTIGNSVFASGTWKLETEHPAYPINYSEISCFIPDGFCTDKFINIDSPRLRDGRVTSTQYSANRGEDTYQIDRWEDGVLEASSTGGCRRVRLTINTNTELVSQTAEDADNEGCEMMLSGGRLPLINGVRVAVLRDGFQTQWDHFEAIRAQLEPFQGGNFDRLRALMPAASRASSAEVPPR